MLIPPPSPTHCVLCGMPLSAKHYTYAEGAFCDDVAGCRRRALAILTDLRSTLVDMHSRLVTFERFEEPAGEPDEPAQHG